MGEVCAPSWAAPIFCLTTPSAHHLGAELVEFPFWELSIHTSLIAALLGEGCADQTRECGATATAVTSETTLPPSPGQQHIPSACPPTYFYIYPSTYLFVC